MKGNMLYFIIITLFVVLVFLIELAAPKEFVWKPTYDKNDREPFGSYVFDDVVSSSVPDYQVINKSFFQIWEDDSTAAPKAFLLTENLPDFSETDVRYLLKLLNNGNQVMICTYEIPDALCDTIKMDAKRLDWDRVSFYTYIEQKQTDRDSIFFGKDTLDYERIYEVVPFIHNHYIRPGKWEKQYVKDTTCFDGEVSLINDTIETRSDSIQIDSLLSTVWIDMTDALTDTLVLVCDRKNNPLAVRFSVGKGELFIVSTPLMFTNFGILDRQNASYTFRLLSYMKGKPLVRTEAYGHHETTSHTPLRYLLVTPPLKWALYIASLLILLFMFFTAKRRQRVIPVVETPPNRTLGFIQLISNLYYSRHDNAEILKTKYAVFCSEIKQQTGVDLLDNTQADSELTRLAEKIGMSEDEIIPLIREFRTIPYQYDVPDSQLKELMDKINRIKMKGQKE